MCSDMSFTEALEVMKQGKKVRVPTWPDSDFMYMQNNVLYNHNGQNHYSFNTLNNMRYELYQDKVAARHLKIGDKFKDGNYTYMVTDLETAVFLSGKPKDYFLTGVHIIALRMNSPNEPALRYHATNLVEKL